MDIEKIREKVSNGFHRFALRLTDGRRLVVPNPDFIAVSKKVVVIIDRKERVHTISPLHIVSIEEEAPGAR